MARSDDVALHGEERDGRDVSNASANSSDGSATASDEKSSYGDYVGVCRAFDDPPARYW